VNDYLVEFESRGYVVRWFLIHVKMIIIWYIDLQHLSKCKHLQHNSTMYHYATMFHFFQELSTPSDLSDDRLLQRAVCVF